MRTMGLLTMLSVLLDGFLVSSKRKKATLGPQNVLPHAQRYSRGATANLLNYDGFHVPFLFSNNGEVLWF